MSTDQITVTETIEVTLPAPDDWISTESDDGGICATPLWEVSNGDALVAYAGGVDREGDYREDLPELKAEALAMLAAVTAAERYQAQRGVTGPIYPEKAS